MLNDKNSHDFYMLKAIALANEPVFSPHPNPRVGCVIVKDDVIIGEGFHEYAGGNHAEVNALAQAGEKAKNSTVYVTLEPCSHFGRTPPCADALIKAQVSHVVIAMKDPNPQVSGQGIEKLKQSGIKVEAGILAQEAKNLNKGFIKRMLTGMPWVCTKIAMSLDGRTSMSNGESKWITSEDARLDVQRLRAKTHALLSGSGTVLADNPRFTVRDISVLKAASKTVKEESSRQPIRIIIDSQNQIKKDANIFNEAGQTIIVGTFDDKLACETSAKSSDDYIQLSSINNKVNLTELMQKLASRNINEVLVEAGPALNGALLSQGLVDELIVYMAFDVMGDSANGMFHLPQLQFMKDKISFTCEDVKKIGKDIRFTLLPVYPFTSVNE